MPSNYIWLGNSFRGSGLKRGGGGEKGGKGKGGWWKWVGGERRKSNSIATEGNMASAVVGTRLLSPAHLFQSYSYAIFPETVLSIVMKPSMMLLAPSRNRLA